MSTAVSAEALREARRQGRAIVGFSIYDLEQGIGVVRAAEAERAPVLIQAGSSAFGFAGREALAGLALGLAREADAAVGVHLDHATEVEEVERCLALGYSSVMFDGSGLPLEQNAELSRRVVASAHAVGAWVEAELAGYAGDEDVSSEVAGGVLTDPSLAAEFVATTGVDALAVAIGNVHGVPSTPVTLDLELLAEIATAVPVPLVLHGASGLPDDALQAAIALGVAKLNVNAELRRAARGAIGAIGTGLPAGDGFAALLEPLILATEATAREKLRVYTAGLELEGEAVSR